MSRVHAHCTYLVACLPTSACVEIKKRNVQQHNINIIERLNADGGGGIPIGPEEKQNRIPLQVQCVQREMGASEAIKDLETVLFVFLVFVRLLFRLRVVRLNRPFNAAQQANNNVRTQCAFQLHLITLVHVECRRRLLKIRQTHLCVCRVHHLVKRNREKKTSVRWSILIATHIERLDPAQYAVSREAKGVLKIICGNTLCSAKEQQLLDEAKQ